jgi:hypothetical protein
MARRDTASRCVLNSVLPFHGETVGADASIVWAMSATDKCPEIRVPCRAQANAGARAEKFVKVICSIQSDRYTRRKEYRFRQSSA